mmetsp:Transcript_83978/g.122791  ORF Transcript_83978/g.122791 Transcript_83978/m.122791 type:complete len:250 (+) Transcript_83978:3-752(+)
MNGRFMISLFVGLGCLPSCRAHSGYQPTKDSFLVFFELSNLNGVENRTGGFVLEVHPSWAPVAVNRFQELVRTNYFKDMRFYTTKNTIISHFGLAADADKTAAWTTKPLKDEPLTAKIQAHKRGLVSFWKEPGVTNSRSTKMFVNFVENTDMDKQGCTPIGYIVRGLDRAGEIKKHGADEQQILQKGNAYLSTWPLMTYITNVTFLASPDEAREAMKRVGTAHYSVKQGPYVHARVPDPLLSAPLQAEL